MNEQLLVSVEHVSKKFCRDLKTSLWYGLKDMGTEIIGGAATQGLRDKEFWAIDDVSFELRRGQCLGLVGHNGAGKSTLLKMLNGLIKPDKGKITMRGRIGALIELGAGFNPILTGRENIFINGQVLGFSKKEIRQKFDAIVDFAEMEKFVDTPVQNYSSGMRVRLGFAVAAQMEPDVLIIDEVLAVGDVGFKIKCYNEIYRIMEKAAVIFVSHSMPQVSKISNKGILLKEGKVYIQSDDISEVVLSYYDQFGGEELSVEGSKKAIIKNFTFGNDNNKVRVDMACLRPTSDALIIENEQKVYFEAEVKLDDDIDHFSGLISISDVDQKVVAQVIPNTSAFSNVGASITIKVEIDSLLLNTGNYTLSIHLFRQSNYVDRGEAILGIRNALKFKIKNNKFEGAAPILYNGKWNFHS